MFTNLAIPNWGTTLYHKANMGIFTNLAHDHPVTTDGSKPSTIPVLRT